MQIDTVYGQPKVPMVIERFAFHATVAKELQECEHASKRDERNGMVSG